MKMNTYIISACEAQMSFTRAEYLLYSTYSICLDSTPFWCQVVDFFCRNPSVEMVVIVILWQAVVMRTSVCEVTKIGEIMEEIVFRIVNAAERSFLTVDNFFFVTATFTEEQNLI